ncbi:MAG: chromate efflux transporter [Devosia indica]|uniref:chromate efflux transporter n=1 Tax=Devosia TaxID=46913 RepID=UPI000CE96D0C|nr:MULTISPECIES: chromate efflux transporter [Devosia]AVF02509.1 chromate transporter [Devosia sp. I507]
MTEAKNRPQGTPGEVFGAFLKLGLTSFGGPIAHLGYFRDELVTRRRWIDEAGYADLVALCQFLPGPASSQVGFALGLMRAGPLGALAAWTAFTLPSALLLLAFALGAAALDGPMAQGALHGLKLVAVAIVAQAVLGMARNLTPDRERALIAVLAVGLVAVVGGALGQVGAILLGSALGLWLCRGGDAALSPHSFPGSRRIGIGFLVAFAVLLVVLPLFAGMGQGIALFDAFYRAGALVFGGGHVVLPLLEAEVVTRGWVSADDFLAGYGATQAMPGPLFTFAAYLGAVSGVEPNGIWGSAIALVAVFLPGMLLLLGALPFWDMLRRWPMAQAGMRGANAAVVGILGAALYDPVFVSAVLQPLDFTLALAGFVALVAWKAPPWLVVLSLGVAGAVTGVL